MIGSVNPASKLNAQARLGLRAIDGEYLGREFALVSGRLLVGRGERSDLRLHSQRVSRAHCVFVRTDHHVIVSDLKSRLGTRVNGHAIERSTRLSLGDRVSVGSCVLQLVATPVMDLALNSDDGTTKHAKS